jgi:hypothetical protein
MLNRSRRAAPALLVALLAACTTPPDESDTEPPARAPTALDAAHQAYLGGDWIALGERVRDVLLDAGASALARENALALLDKAYEVNAGLLPSAFVPTAGVEKVIFGEINSLGPDGPELRVFVKVRMRDASHVTSVTVRRLPGETILDKASGRGTYQIKHDVPGFEDANLEAVVPALPRDGVFTIRVELDDGASTEGWFLGRSLASSAVPDLRSPQASQSFADPNPQVRWVPFRSPQYRPFERRSLSVWEIGKDHAGRAQSWGYWTGEPGDLDALRIGRPPAGAPEARLEAGDYFLVLDAAETRAFGPVWLHRMSRRTAPFHVVR